VRLARGGAFLVAIALSTTCSGSTGAPDAFGYTWSDARGGCVARVPPFGPGAINRPATTAVIGPVNLPWSWPWLGRNVTSAWISPTGYVTFSDQGSAVGSQQVLPNATVPNDLIAAFWFTAFDADITHEATPDFFHVRWSLRTTSAPASPRAIVDLVLLPGGPYQLIWTDAGGVTFATVGHEDSAGLRGRTMYRNPIARESGFPTPDGGQSACVYPAAVINCSLATSLACGEVRRVSYTASAGATTYSCTTPSLSAGEVLLNVDLPEFSVLDVQSSDPAAWLLHLASAPACDEWHCLDAGQGRISIAAQPGRHVFSLDSDVAVPGTQVDVQATCRPLGLPLSCGDDAVGDTSVGTTMFDERGCTLDSMGGHELLYRITLGSPTLLSLELDGADPNLWLQVHGAAGFAANGSACLAARRGSLALSLPAGDFVVVVDGPPGSEGTYTLHARCGAGLVPCAGAPTLACNVPANGLSVAPGAFHSYSCGRAAALGGESVWEFSNPLDQTVSFKLMGGDPRLSVAVLNACDPAACVTFGRNPVCRDLPGGDYYVVVDGPAGSESPFQITATCGSTAVGGADLRVTAVDTTGMVTACVGLDVSGIARVTVANAGDQDVLVASSVVVFEDRDGDGTYGGAGVDGLLGQQAIPPLPAFETATADVALSGVIRFRDARLWAQCDAGSVVLEVDETNDVGSSSARCAGASTSDFDPVVEWEWTGSTVLPDHLAVVDTPLIGDVSGDGVADVVISTKVPQLNLGDAVVRALSGRDGSELWTATDPAARVRGWSQAALADLDQDGRPDIVAQSEVDPRRVVAISSSGSLMWTSAPIIGVLDDHGVGGPTICDIDGDGRPEIAWGAEVLRADGSRYWTAEAGGTIGTFGALSEYSISIAADVLGDARAEVIAGPTAYTDDGSGVGRIAWHAAGLPDGFTALGDLDQDGAPEVVLAGDGSVFLLDAATGVVKWSVLLPWGNASCPGQSARVGPPVIADFDGDYRPDIAIAAAPNMILLDGDGNVKWQADLASCNAFTSPSAFDFQGDGRSEVVFLQGSGGSGAVANVLDGRDGSLRLTLPAATRSSMESVVVADVDGDDNAELVVPLSGAVAGVRVYGDRRDGWVRTRAIWNENAYHVTNIGDSGIVPSVEEDSWLATGTYRTQIGAEPAALPDLTVAILSTRVRLTPTCGRELVITTRIGNAGSARAGAAFSASVFDGDPLAGGTLLTVVSIDDLAADEYRDVVTVMPLTGLGAREIHVFVDGDGVRPETIRECREDNNACVLTVSNPPEGVDLPADVGAALRVTEHGDPRAPSISARLSWTGDEGAPRTVEHFHVYRSDRPDMLTFQGGLERVAATDLVDVTNATDPALLPECQYYRILAADDCEQESPD
jgi:hypothetical protein